MRETVRYKKQNPRKRNVYEGFCFLKVAPRGMYPGNRPTPTEPNNLTKTIIPKYFQTTNTDHLQKLYYFCVRYIVRKKFQHDKNKFLRR